MDWMKFYKKWATEVGSTIKEDVFLAWQAFVADADDSTLSKAVDEIAVWYNAKSQRSEGYVASITLYQLRDAYNRFFKADHPVELTKCGKCEGEGYVFVADNGKYTSPDFPPEKANAVCVIPCPVCRSNEYSARGLRDRVFNRCRPSSKRDELYARGGK